MRHVQKREDVQGRPFLLEHDLKDGDKLRMDKTGKTIMVLLRHLGRVQEVRNIH